MDKMQEPKYYINHQFRVCNRESFKPIPDDEPIFIFRAKDRNAINALIHYQNICKNENHKAVIGSRIEDFERFANKNFLEMKEPDSE